MSQRKVYFCRFCNARAIETECSERHCEKCNSKNIVAYETFSGTRYRCQDCGHDSKTVQNIPYEEIACPYCGTVIKEYWTRKEILAPNGIYSYYSDRECEESVLRNKIYEDVVEDFFVLKEVENEALL